MPYFRALTVSFFDFISIPVWWYSTGLMLEFRRLVKSISDINYLTGFLVWLTHIFVPMYGQTDWKGRLISFLVRLFQIIIRGFALILLVTFRSVISLLYLAFPIFLILGLIISING